MELERFYTQLAVIHGASGFVGKIALISVVLLIHKRVRRPGEQLFAGVVCTQLLISAWMLVSTATQPNMPSGTATVPVGIAVVSLVVAICFGIAVAKPEGEWSAKGDAGWKSAVGLAALVFAIYYPMFTRGWIRPFFFSPTGVLPQPTLIVAATLAWLSMPNTPRIAGWAAGLGALVIGGIDVLNDIRAGWVLIGLAGLTGWELARSTMHAGGVLEDDEPPVQKEKRVKLKREVKEKVAPVEQKRWKLK